MWRFGLARWRTSAIAPRWISRFTILPVAALAVARPPPRVVVGVVGRKVPNCLMSDYLRRYGGGQ